MDSIPASDKIGAIMFEWLINLSPVGGGLAQLLMSIGALWLIRLVVEFRVLRLGDEFRSFLADGLLALAYVCGLALVQTADDRVHWTRSSFWVGAQVVILIGWIAFGLFHMARERGNYSSARPWLAPTALYHNAVLYVVMGYSITVVCTTGFIAGEWSLSGIVLRLIILAMIVMWGFATIYDEGHPMTIDGQLKLHIVNIEDGWPWQHKYRREHFMKYWRRLSLGKPV